jgi:hypothetical protein
MAWFLRGALHTYILEIFCWDEENLQKRCLRNVALKSFMAHSEPPFKQ